MGRLENAEFVKEPVVLGIRDLGRVLDVIEMVGPSDLLPQRFDPSGGIARGRHCEVSRRSTVSATPASRSSSASLAFGTRSSGPALPLLA